MAKVELKQPIIEEISSLLDGAQAMVVVNYRGLTVEEDTKLRKALREGGVTYKVYKNTYIRRAVAGTEFEAVAELLEGPTAIAVVAGTYYDAKMMQVIASIPSREVLLGKLLGSIQSPIANFARVIKQIAEKDEAVA